MKKVILILLFTFLGTPVFANDSPNSKNELAFLAAAENNLKECQTVHNDNLPDYGDEGGLAITEERVKTAEDYKQCTDDIFMSLLDHYYTDEKTKEFILQHYQDGLDNISRTVGPLYSSADFCKPTCGLMYQYDVTMHETGFITSLIRTIVDYHRNFYSY